MPEGWSAQPKSCVSKLCLSEAGVCLVSTSEARRALSELEGEQPLAVLSPLNIDGAGMKINVLIEDISGLWQTRRRFVMQLGTAM